MSESVQAHTTPIVNLVASKPLDSNSPDAFGTRQQLISVGGDGEVRIWTIELDDDHLAVSQQRRAVKLHLLFHVRVYLQFCCLRIDFRNFQLHPQLRAATNVENLEKSGNLTLVREKSGKMKMCFACGVLSQL